MLTELAALLDLLKAKGVTHARLEPMALPAPFGVIDVTFGSPADATPERPSEPQDTCKGCGHGLAEHQGGLCMHGCDEEKCA